MLLKQGLLAEHRFTGKTGIMDFITQAGCVQFDPVDVCGKNADIVLQSRVKGYAKSMLQELLYKDRLLVDYFDKNLSIFPAADWKYFGREREANRLREKSRDRIDEVSENIKSIIHKKGFACSRDLEMTEKVDWYWSSTALARAALESLYFQGELVIHHKKGTQKYYALAKDCLPAEILSSENPCKDDNDYMQWRILRRIGAAGLLWNRASDAWLGITGISTASRNKVFAKLLEQGSITELSVEGIKYPLYCLSCDLDLIETVTQNSVFKERTELIAPLDSLMWDRKLINELFGFSYKWEIYTPKGQRKYAHYVLPILSGDSFVGRAELICDRKRKSLHVNNVWFEDGVKNTKKLSSRLDVCFKRFSKFNECDTVIYAK